jgi:signal transduction histidine kinase
MRSTAPRTGAAPRHVTRLRLVVAGRPWLLELSSRPEFEGLSQRRMLPWLALLSLLACVLLARITYVQARSRREAERSAAQLEGLTARLRESDQRKDEFIAVLAHELRNPLAPIRTSLEILERVPEGEQARRARGIAMRQLRHMVRLVDDLLDVSRISRGKIVLQRQQLPLAEPVQAAVETSRPLMEARRHRLEVAPVAPGLRVDGDPTRLAQILTNLLNNAATYTPEGGRVAVETCVQGGEARVTVRDNGMGIEPRRLQQVFELFVQVDRGGTGGGLGIGLNLAARLAELHGGRIEAHSGGLGQGAAFTLVLPLAAAAPLG